MQIFGCGRPRGDKDLDYSCSIHLKCSLRTFGAPELPVRKVLLGSLPAEKLVPEASIDVIAQNLSLRLHTLVYLDIQDDRYMTVPEAVILLEQMAEELKMHIPLYVGIARAGSDNPLVRAGTAGLPESVDFGPPLHILVVPAELHEMERTYLEMFAGL